MKNYLPSFVACLCWLFTINVSAQTGIPRIIINSMGHSAKVQNLSFTPDGEKIITVSEDKTARVWNFNTGEMLKKYESQIGDGFDGMLYASAVSPDGKWLAIGGLTPTKDNQVYIAVIDLAKNLQVSTIVGHTDVVNSLAFSGDGKYLLSCSDDGNVKVWSTKTVQFEMTANIPAGGPAKYMAVNPVTNDVAVVVEGKSEIQVYNLVGVDKGAVKTTPRLFKKHRGEVNKLAYAADGSFLASSSFSKELILWRADGSVVKDFSVENNINAIAFSPDAKIMVALDERGKGMSYGLPSGNKFTDFSGHDNTVFAAAFCPTENGNYVVASAGGNNNEIYLWNPINGKTIRKIRGKGSAIQDIEFGAGLELFISTQVNGKP
ncbi:MAG TPA: hypothetical protein DGG95_09460, partial [Cytophagales bacterium]|nr:hypothetical protein [Cytophagales bacterium]